MTDGGDCNIPIAFLKKPGDKNNNRTHQSWTLLVAMLQSQGGAAQQYAQNDKQT